MTGNRQCGFTKGKSCLNNLITFFNKMIVAAAKGRAVEVVYLKFSQAFGNVSRSVLIPR